MFTVDTRRKDVHIIITKDDDKLSFIGNHYRSFMQKNDNNLTAFDFLIEYIKFRCSKDPTYDVGLYKLYSSAMDVLGAYSTTEVINKQLQEVMFKIIDHLDYNTIRNWIPTFSGFTVPTAVNVEFDDIIIRDGLGTREQTYVRDDYIGLSSLAVIFKALLPIWSHYIFIRSIDIAYILRDYYVFNLIHEHPVFSSDAFNKLQIYVDTTKEKQLGGGVLSSARSDATPMNLAMKGINSEDLSDWLIAGIVIRKLPVSDIVEINSNSNLITNIYGFVKQKLTFTPDVKSRITDKNSDNNAIDDEDKTSTLEQYNTITSNLAPGHIVEINWYYGNVYKICKKFYSDVPIKLVDRFSSNCNVLLDREISYPQRVLVGWVLKKALDPRAIPYMSKKTLVGMIALAAAVLWKNDHKYLSLLLSGFKRIKSDNDDVIALVEFKSRISKDLKEELIIYYPFHNLMRTTNDQNTVNPILGAINILSNEIFNNIWVTTGTKDMVIETQGEYSNILHIRHDIKILLVKLIIQLGKKDQPDKTLEAHVTTSGNAR